AAAVLLIVAGVAWFIGSRRDNGLPAVAQQNKPADNAATKPADGKGANPADVAAQTPAQTPATTTEAGKTTTTAEPKDNAAKNDDLESSMNEEMYHYAKLVEIKHKELRSIEKDEPLLYRQFATDVSKLDSVYRGLQQQLPKNPNREQLLEAMLQNLQLQMGLLNHQLDIIKQINHSKKTAYEKAYKTA
ncbi:MAG TPA: hypothetical protein VNU70_02220, partial [Puia sp.]|nr:hypothetical protein [Puia sp.]